MATTDNAPNKPVHLVYLGGGLLLFYLLKWTTDWIWGYFTRAPNEFYVTAGAALAALVIGIAFYRHERTFDLVNEVCAELKKVSWPTAKEVKAATIVVIVMTISWPTAKEVKAATIVVIVMTIISAIILGFFDFIWSNVTQFIYG